MAIRLRLCPEGWLALCAARSVPKEGDVYLDDAQHHALTVKFDLDIASARGHEPWHRASPEAAAMEREESNNPARDWWDAEYAPRPDPAA